MGDRLGRLSEEIRACRICERHLPLGPRPVFVARASARIALVGHAPGTRVHASGVPWDDASGDTLRAWLEMDREHFDTDPALAIIPAGFCYPGKARGGDAPPRPECAATWHGPLFAAMPNIRLIVALGRYAHALTINQPGKTLSDTVADHARHLADGVFPLPHPSPRNRIWIRRRPWFEAEVLPALRAAVAAARGS